MHGRTLQSCMFCMSEAVILLWETKILCLSVLELPGSESLHFFTDLSVKVKPGKKPIFYHLETADSDL